MIGLLRAAFVIARRDYIATVWSKTFLIFLLAPVLPVLLGALASGLSGGGNDDQPRQRGGIAVVMDAGSTLALNKARAHLAPRLDRGTLPELRGTHHPEEGQPRLTGTLDHPKLIGPPDFLHDMGGPIALIIDQARAEQALGERAPAPVNLETAAIAVAPATSDRIDVARGGQLILFFLTILLAGMMISNMVEEKSSKVIELLAAAVPIDAVFFGKLLAILGASITGLAVWSAMGLTAAATLIPAGTLPTPALGWPIFLALGFVYFVTVFLLWGAIYLAIGAQAGSAREAQTMSMPMTLGEAVAYIIASSSAAHPDRPLGLIAAAIPWSSPFAMIGRAATEASVWPHLFAVAWQFIAIGLTVRVGARLFRTNILKSGRTAKPARRRWWFGR